MSNVEEIKEKEIKDKELLMIEQIRNLSFIKIYDIASFELDDSRRYTLPAMMINYDGNKYLNLSGRDKYFDQFVKKVQQVYLKEKETARVDTSYSPFVSEAIKIDPVSEKILLSGNLLREGEIYDFYTDKKFYNHSLLFDKDDMRFILPTLKYNFKEFMGKAGIVINYPEDVRLFGYRENYSIDAKVNGYEDKLLFEFNQTDTGYKIGVRSFQNLFPDSEVNITINTDAIYIDLEMIGKETNSEVIYELINKPSVRKITYINGIMTEFDKKPLTQSEKPDYLLPLLKEYDGDWYQLPWGDWYGIKEEIERISEFEKIATRDSKFVSMHKDGFLIHDDYRKKWVKDAAVNTVEKIMILDDIKKTIKGKRLYTDIFLLETHFIDRASTNDQKYFYHVSNRKRVSDITLGSLASLSKDNNIMCSGDLRDIESIYEALGKRLK